MRSDIVKNLKTRFDALACTSAEENIEFWFARDLQEPLGYARWENFISAIKRSVESCNTTGYDPNHHFRGVTKKVELGSGAVRENFFASILLPIVWDIAKNFPQKQNHRKSGCTPINQAFLNCLN